MLYHSARQVFHDAFITFAAHPTALYEVAKGSPGPHQIHAKETHASRQSDNQIVNSCEMGQIQSAVAKLPPVPRSWGMWCYTDIFTRRDHERVRQHLFAYTTGRYGEWFHSDFTKTFRMISLVNLAMEDMKLRLNGQQPITLVEIAALLDMNKQHIKRDGWVERMDHLQAVMDGLDMKALQPVSALINLRGEKARSSAS